MRSPLWITGYDSRFEEIAQKHFFPSFEKCYMQHQFDLVVHKIEAPFGSYGQEQYNASYAKEMDFVLDLMQRNRDRIVIWSDIDLHFYRSPMDHIKETISRYDLSCQMDSPDVHCTGFMYFWCAQKIINFFYLWRALNQKGGWQSAQDSFNEAIKQSPNLVVQKLPKQFYTHGLDTSEVWDGKDITKLPKRPKDCILHHGNWTIGLENKMALMDTIAA